MTGELQEAKVAYQRCLEIVPHFPEALANLSTVQLDLHEINSAYDSATKALELEPTLAPAVRVLTHLEFERGNFSQALQWTSRSRELEPDNPDVHLECGQIFEKLNRIEEAISSFSKTLEIQPLNPSAHLHLAMIYSRMQDYREAKRCFETTLKIQPDMVSALEGLGSLHRILGENQEALQVFQKILSQAPRDPVAKFETSALRGEFLSSIPLEYVRYLFDPLPIGFEEESYKQIQFLVPQKILAEFQKLPPFDAVEAALDLGCGSGYSALSFKGLARKWIGVDLSLTMVREAAAREFYKRIEQTDILSFLTQETSSFGLFLALNVLPYFGDLKPVFKALSRRAILKARLLLSARALNEGDFKLGADLRFSHSLNYLLSCAQDSGWKPLSKIEAELSQTEILDRGHLVILEFQGS
jgi:predicted TPR repeat methyltransferase